MQKRNIIITIILIIALCLGYYFTRAKDADQANIIPLDDTSTGTTTSTSPFDSSGVNAGLNISSTGSSTVELIKAKPTSTLPPAPNYRRTFTYPSYFTAEAKAITDKTIADLQIAVDKDKMNLVAWIELGNQYNLVKDFQGARLMWEYAVALNPNHFLAYANLGTLYMSDLRDYAKAESNFKLSIKADAHQIPVYRSLYELYRYGLKDDVRAKAILQQGISSNPGKAADLQNLLDHYNEV